MNQTFEELLVSHCAPTLAGLKTGSLFCFGAAPPGSVRRLVCHWHRRLQPRGLSVVLLLERRAPRRSVVYVYRKSQLRLLLESEECRAFLRRCGYREENTDGMLRQLACRMAREKDFPHEIGVFLGYPLRDVVGFIENRGQNFTCCGCWKSYGDPEAAQKRFECYQRCTACYMRMFARGIPVEKMALPT